MARPKLPQSDKAIHWSVKLSPGLSTLVLAELRPDESKTDLISRLLERALTRPQPAGEYLAASAPRLAPRKGKYAVRKHAEDCKCLMCVGK